MFHLIDIMETLVRQVRGVSGWVSTRKKNKCLLVDSAPHGSRHCFQESFPALCAGTHTHSLRQQSSYVGDQLEQLGLPNKLRMRLDDVWCYCSGQVLQHTKGPVMGHSRQGLQPLANPEWVPSTCATNVGVIGANWFLRGHSWAAIPHNSP